MTWSQGDTNAYQTQLMTLKFRSKLSHMRIRIKGLSLLEGKEELKFFYIKWLDDCQTS